MNEMSILIFVDVHTLTGLVTVLVRYLVLELGPVPCTLPRRPPGVTPAGPLSRLSYALNFAHGSWVRSRVRCALYRRLLLNLGPSVCIES